MGSSRNGGRLDPYDLHPQFFHLRLVDVSLHEVIVHPADFSEVVGEVHDIAHMELGFNSN